MGPLLAVVIAAAAAEPPPIVLAGEPTRIGALTVSARDLRPAEGRTWMRHELVFRNRGGKPVTVQDTRSSRFLEERRLLAADDGCGYALDGPGEPVQAGACRGYLDRFIVPAHGSVRRNVFLWKNLRGMRRLEPGTYTFPRPVQTRRRTGVAELVYEVGPR